MSSSNEKPAPLIEHVLHSVWRVLPVSEYAEACLQRWQVFEVDGGDRHLVGWSPEAFEGRVSSKIVEFDPARRVCRTRSGRLYELVGEPGLDRDAAYVWDAWRQINNIVSCADITEQVAEAIARANAGSEQP